MTTTERTDIYQTITDQIIAVIEAGAATWSMPWHGHAGGSLTMPLNAVSKRAYRGINILMLWACGQAAGYPTGLWATYKQWTALGAQVRKGEKAAPVVFWKTLDSADADDQDDDARKTARCVARAFHVFNAAQVEGFDAPVVPARPEGERGADAEVFFAAISADLRHGGHRAFYNPGTDCIQMPPFAAFASPVAYYAVVSQGVV